MHCERSRSCASVHNVVPTASNNDQIAAAVTCHRSRSNFVSHQIRFCWCVCVAAATVTPTVLALILHTVAIVLYYHSDCYVRDIIRDSCMSRLLVTSSTSCSSAISRSLDWSLLCHCCCCCCFYYDCHGWCCYFNGSIASTESVDTYY
jgi:hypothetical protein